MMATAPITHEMTAAGPAVARAPWAPNSHPEPMIEPPDAHSRPMKPISRRRPGLPRCTGEAVSAAGVRALATATACARNVRRGIGRSDDRPHEPPAHPIDLRTRPTGTGRGTRTPRTARDG